MGILRLLKKGMNFDMATCPRCGAWVPDERDFCTTCGGDMTAPAASYAPPEHSAGAYGRPRGEGGYATREPAYVYTNPGNKPANVLGTGGFVGSIILMSLPVIGFIISVFWACGATQNLNRRNHARAHLILSIILMVMTGAAYYIIDSYLVSLGLDGISALLQ